MEGFEKLSFTKKVDIIAKIVSCFKQMYKMTREKKGPIALLEQLVVKGFKFGFNGYYLALINEDSNKMETFKDECDRRVNRVKFNDSLRTNITSMIA